MPTRRAATSSSCWSWPSRTINLPPDTVTKIIGSPINSSTSSQIFAESSLDSTLQSGQLDAASAFVTQAKELHLAYVPLPAAINLGSFALASTVPEPRLDHPPARRRPPSSGSPQVIDITIIGKPTPAAIAFVKWTLSQAGLAIYDQGGFSLLSPPTVTGPTSSIPAAITSELGG